MAEVVRPGQQQISFDNALVSMHESIKSISKELDTIQIIINQIKPANDKESSVINELRSIRQTAAINFVSLLLFVGDALNNDLDELIELYEIGKENNQQGSINV